MAVKVESGSVFSWDVPQAVLRREGMGLFDVDPNGEFFVIKEAHPKARIKEISVVVNWAGPLGQQSSEE